MNMIQLGRARHRRCYLGLRLASRRCWSCCKSLVSEPCKWLERGNNLPLFQTQRQPNCQPDHNRNNHKPNPNKTTPSRPPSSKPLLVLPPLDPSRRRLITCRNNSLLTLTSTSTALTPSLLSIPRWQARCISIRRRLLTLLNSLFPLTLKSLPLKLTLLLLLRPDQRPTGTLLRHTQRCTRPLKSRLDR